MKKLTLLSLALALSLVSCGSPQNQPASESKVQEQVQEESQEQKDSVEESQERNSDEIIRDIVTYHGSYGAEADNKVKELIDELDKQDSTKATLWKNIMDYWDYANSELQVNTDKLPNDLPDDDSLCIVVLGFELNDDGSMQDELIGRLNVAMKCAEQYPNSYIVCTGGGTAKDNKDVTEADLMGEWLVENGLDEKRLIIENKSLTTAQNALFSYDILLNQYPQVNSVALVSSSYHIAWGSLLFESAFMKTASEHSTPEIHIISNCSYKTENDKYSDVLRFETGGMLQLIGEDNLAMEYYGNTYTKPEL
ncbi:MAG: YdcF family protein [Ruminococcus sp.]|nr:YdcF family protein [Ruminococcus sp.]